jgi:hypothetical protein
MSMKSFVPDSPTRYRVRGATLAVMALWMMTTYILMCHPPLVLNTGAVVLLLVAVQDFITAHRLPVGAVGYPPR